MAETSAESEKEADRGMPRKAAKKPRRKKAAKKAGNPAIESLRELDPAKLQGAMEKIFQLVWKNENALAKHIDSIGKAVDRIPKRLETLQAALKKTSKKMEALEKAIPESPGTPSGEALEPVRKDLEDLGAKVIELRQALASLQSVREDGLSLEEVRTDLDVRLDTLASQLERLEKTPPPDPTLSPEAIRALIEREFEALESRVEIIEKAPPTDPGPSPHAVQASLRGELQALASRIAAMEKAAPPEGSGMSDDAVKDLIRKGIQEAMDAVKGMLSQIEPTVEATLEKRLNKRLQEVPSKQEVSGLLRKAVESASPGPAAAAPDAGVLKTELLLALKPEVVKEIRKAASGVFNSPNFKDLVMKLIDLEALERSVRDHIEGDVFMTLLNSNDMKELLDDKFKAMRIWLRNEEIPRQIKKQGGE